MKNYLEPHIKPVKVGTLLIVHGFVWTVTEVNYVYADDAFVNEYCKISTEHYSAGGKAGQNWYVDKYANVEQGDIVNISIKYKRLIRIPDYVPVKTAKQELVATGFLPGTIVNKEYIKERLTMIKKEIDFLQKADMDLDNTPLLEKQKK